MRGGVPAQWYNRHWRTSQLEAEFRLWAFYIAYEKLYASVMDRAERFVLSIAYSSQPTLHPDLVRKWKADYLRGIRPRGNRRRRATGVSTNRTPKVAVAERPVREYPDPFPGGTADGGGVGGADLAAGVADEIGD